MVKKVFTAALCRLDATGDVCERVHAWCRGPRLSAAGVTMGKDGKNACRVSVTFTRRQYDEIDRLSKKQGGSMSWFVRRATERLIEQENGGPMLPLTDDNAVR